MKINDITEKLEERFDNKYVRDEHFYKHVAPDKKLNDSEYRNKLTFTLSQFPNAVEYEKSADNLAKTPLSKDVLGYVRKDGKYAKYRKSTKEFVVYSVENGEPIDITYFLCERKYWDGQKKKEGGEGYFSSIDPEKDVR